MRDLTLCSGLGAGWRQDLKNEGEKTKRKGANSKPNTHTHLSAPFKASIYRPTKRVMDYPGFYGRGCAFYAALCKLDTGAA